LHKDPQRKLLFEESIFKTENRNRNTMIRDGSILIGNTNIENLNINFNNKARRYKS